MRYAKVARREIALVPSFATRACRATRFMPRTTSKPSRRPPTRSRLPRPPTGPSGAAGEAPTLRLAIGREGIGLELERPLPLGCLRVSALAMTFRGMRFPVDVSGGVSRFRHRHADLQRLEIDLDARAFETWASPRLRGLVGERSPDVAVSFRDDAIAVCISHPTAADDAAGAAAPIVAFDLSVFADDEDLLLVVAMARGADLPEPPTAMACACVGILLGDHAIRSGSTFRVRRLARLLARRVLPDAGARVPSADAVRCSAIFAQGDTLSLLSARDVPSAPASAATVRAVEAANRLRRPDDALHAGALDEARAGYLTELERAPRDPQALRRLIEIDGREPGRAEAALAEIAELTGQSAERLGVVVGEIRVHVGDIAGAVAALEHAAETEPCGPLAARAFERAATLSADLVRASAFLDRGIVRAPRSGAIRWTRVDARLALGRLGDALADVENLEALARTPRAKHVVWMRAGAAWQRAGLGARAGAIFERALRFAPDDPAALAGLGSALVSDPISAPGPHDPSGRRAARGVALLSRAIDRTHALGQPAAALELDLARALADRLDDLPGAIAHASLVPAEAAECAAARALEGRWRGRLGDAAGASLAFAQLRERAAAAAPSMARPAWDAKAESVVDWLVEAAVFEQSVRGDLLAAQRHLAAAVRIDPHHDAARLAFRAVGLALVARPEEPIPPRLAPAPDDPGEEPPHVELPPAPPGSAFAGALGTPPGDPFAETDDEDAEKAGRVEDLTRRLHADPANDAVADELAGLLESLGRHHELLALLSARLEDATPAKRPLLLPRFREALQRLAQSADSAGRPDEASLYRGVLAAAND
jgi:tetratricopeptide (TPR) repeat protein